jgi:hypothetical protein
MRDRKPLLAFKRKILSDSRDPMVTRVDQPRIGGLNWPVDD